MAAANSGAGERTRPRVLFAAPSQQALTIPTAWLDIQIASPRLAKAPIVAREARAVPETLQPDLLGVLCLNPAAQIIRQHGVHPIAARAQNFNFAARRQRQNTVCCVRCRETRLDIVARHDGEPAAFAPIVEGVNRPDGQTANEQTQNR